MEEVTRPSNALQPPMTPDQINEQDERDPEERGELTMSPMLQIVLDTEVARHKRELSEAFAALREELTPPPRRVGDPSWRYAQMALNDAARWQLAAIGMPDAQSAQAQMNAVRPSLNPFFSGFAGGDILSALAGPGYNYNASAHAAAYPGF